MTITINILKHHPEAIQKLANLCYERICKPWTPHNTLKEVELWFDDWINENIPMAFLALDSNKPIGMCSLQLNDGIRPDLMPWLGDLCVDSAYEKRGVGKLLIDAAKRKASEQGYRNLYLFAPDPKIPAYYARYGWKKIGIDNHHAQIVTIMEIKL